MAAPKQSAHKCSGKRLLLGQSALIGKGKKLGSTLCDTSPGASGPINALGTLTQSPAVTVRWRQGAGNHRKCDGKVISLICAYCQSPLGPSIPGVTWYLGTGLLDRDL